MNPWSGMSFDAWIGCSLVRWFDLVLLVGGCKVLFVVSWSVSDDYLTWILIRHDHLCNWKATSVGVWVIRLQWLSSHSGVKDLSLFVGVTRKWFGLAWLVEILIACWMLPACFLERICDGNWLTCSSCQNMWTGVDSSFSKVRIRLFILFLGKFFRVMDIFRFSRGL